MLIWKDCWISGRWVGLFASRREDDEVLLLGGWRPPWTGWASRTPQTSAPDWYVEDRYVQSRGSASTDEERQDCDVFRDRKWHSHQRSSRRNHKVVANEPLEQPHPSRTVHDRRQSSHFHVQRRRAVMGCERLPGWARPMPKRFSREQSLRRKVLY